MNFSLCKKTLLVTICAIFLMVCPVLAGDKVIKTTDPVDTKNIAVVNGTPILKTDFDIEFDQFKNRFMQKGQTIPPAQIENAKKEILDSLINQELLYQESVKQGFKVDDAEISQNLAKIKKGFPSEAEFQNAITAMNLTVAGISEKIKRGLVVNKMIEKALGEKIVVSDDETKGFYEGNPTSFSKPEQVKASHILVKVDAQSKDTDKEVAKKKIASIQEKIKNGEKFDELAKAHSDCPSGAKGGDLGFFGRGSMVKSFEEAAFSMKPGDISDIVETQFGYHLIKVTDKKEAQKISYQDAKENIEKYLKRKKTEEEVNVLITALKKDAKIVKHL